MDHKTALLVMDMQMGILGKLAGSDAFINGIATAIEYARKNNMPVIYVVLGFRKGFPEIGTNNKRFATVKQSMAEANLDEFSKIIPALAPRENDVIVTKRRFSAFTGSDLEVVLRAKGIQQIVLAGVSTSGVVLSTLREAADKDYQINVLSNGCFDPEQEVHEILINTIFPKQADVLTIEAWINK